MFVVSTSLRYLLSVGKHAQAQMVRYTEKTGYVHRRSERSEDGFLEIIRRRGDLIWILTSLA